MVSWNFSITDRRRAGPRPMVRPISNPTMSATPRRAGSINGMKRVPASVISSAPTGRALMPAPPPLPPRSDLVSSFPPTPLPPRTHSSHGRSGSLSVRRC